MLYQNRYRLCITQGLVACIAVSLKAMRQNRSFNRAAIFMQKQNFVCVIIFFSLPKATFLIDCAFLKPLVFLHYSKHLLDFEVWTLLFLWYKKTEITLVLVVDNSLVLPWIGRYSVKKRALSSHENLFFCLFDFYKRTSFSINFRVKMWWQIDVWVFLILIEKWAF